MFFVAIALIIATVGFRRWRHLFTFLGSVLVLEVLGILLIAAYKRPRPYDVTTIGRWRGYSLPSAPAAIVSFTVVGIIYMLVVPGRSRTIAKILGATVVAVCVASRASTSPSTTPSTSWSASPSEWRSRSTPSASSRRTRSSR